MQYAPAPSCPTWLHQPSPPEQPSIKCIVILVNAHHLTKLGSCGATRDCSRNHINVIMPFMTHALIKAYEMKRIRSSIISGNDKSQFRECRIAGDEAQYIVLGGLGPGPAAAPGAAMHMVVHAHPEGRSASRPGGAPAGAATATAMVFRGMAPRMPMRILECTADARACTLCPVLI